MKNTNNRSGSVSAVTTKETIEKQFASGKEVVGKEYCSLCEKYMKTTNDCAVPGGVECNGMFVQCGDIPCKYFEKKQKDTRSPALKKAFDESIDYNWSFCRAPDENVYAIVALDPKGWQPILAKTDKFLVEHICKMHNDWLAFKQKQRDTESKKDPIEKRVDDLENKQKDEQKEFPIGIVVDRAINDSPWYFAPSQKFKNAFQITTPNEDPDESFVVTNNIHYRPIAEHICKLHNDWRNFKMKNGEKKIKKGNLRRLKNLAWRMKTFRQAFQLIQKNNYLGFDSIKIWIEQNEDDVNQWIFTKWLKNSSNYEDWTWFFNNRGTSLQNIPSNEYFELCDSCEYIDYFRFGNDRSMNGVPEGEWDSYTFHQEYESKLFADGKDFTAALVLEKMFDFAEEYVKHTGYITAEMANKYHIDLHLVEVNADSDVLLDKMNPDAANRVRKIVEDDESYNPNEKNLEQRVDNLEKMVRDIWENVCADKQPTPYTEAPSHGSSSSADEWNKADGVEAWNNEDHPFPKEIINKKPVLEGQKCPRCRKSKEGCEFYDKGTCRGICYPTYPPQFDPCVFEK